MTGHAEMEHRTALAAILLAASLAAGVAAANQPHPAASITLGRSATIVCEPAEFTEHDTVYARVTMTGLRDGVHRLEALWCGKNGEVRDRTRLTITAKNGTASATLWLRFHPADDPVFSWLSIVREKEQWHLYIGFDGTRIAEKRFAVIR